MRGSSLKCVSVREVVPRVVADSFSLGAAVFLGASVCLLGGYVLGSKYPDPSRIELSLPALYLPNVLTLLLVGIVVFALSGFYTHARGYRGRFKVLVIFNALSLTFLLQSFLESAPSRVLLAWLFALGLIGGHSHAEGIWGAHLPD